MFPCPIIRPVGLDDAGKDIYQDIAYPVTRQFRQELYDEIVKEFNFVMEEEG